jgi:hypothetical protein
MSKEPRMYLAMPMPVYGTPASARAYAHDWTDVTGEDVVVVTADGYYRSTQDWLARWARERSLYTHGAFLDDDGWVGRGVHIEVTYLLTKKVPVWWYNNGTPTQDWHFSSTDYDDWVHHARVIPGQKNLK